MKTPAVINLFGGPAAGKSTTAAGIFVLLKLHDMECELSREFAKDLVWEERKADFGDQHYIFGQQHHRLWTIYGKVDFVISDCPLMLSPIYGERYKTTTKAFEDNVVNTVKKYNNFNVILKRNKPYNKNGRNETEEEAKEIDLAVKRMLYKHRMPWTEVNTDLEGINMIAKKILGRKFKIGLHGFHQ